MIANTLSDADRWFWPRVQVGEPDACWLWMGGVHHRGYGAVKVSGRQCGPHQVAFWLTHGQPEHDVLHECGTRLCCNPAHLYDGDDQQNAADRARHGRTARLGGEANPQARLTDQQVNAIRLSAAPAPTLAEQYGVHLRHIYRIRSGERRSSTLR